MAHHALSLLYQAYDCTSGVTVLVVWLVSF